MIGGGSSSHGCGIGPPNRARPVLERAFFRGSCEELEPTDVQGDRRNSHSRPPNARSRTSLPRVINQPRRAALVGLEVRERGRASRPAAWAARKGGQDGIEDEALRSVLCTALIDLQHRGFSVPDGLDPALAEVGGALMNSGRV